MKRTFFFQPHRNRFIMLPSLKQWNMRISKTNAIKIALFLPDLVVFSFSLENEIAEGKNNNRTSER